MDIFLASIFNQLIPHKLNDQTLFQSMDEGLQQYLCQLCTYWQAVGYRSPRRLYETQIV